MTNKILVVTDVSARMQEYYESSIQRATEESIEEEFRKIEDVPELSLFDDESEGVEGESVEELAELLNKLSKKTKKKVLH
jgi:ubiquinone biosynthesis protein UbiJ